MQWLKDFQAKATTMVAQFNNATFKNATMAVCALMAAADGTVSKDERSKVAKLIVGNQMLSVFQPTDLRDTFEEYCVKAEDEFSRLDLLQVVRKLKGNESQADTALKVALIIANADGTFDDSEKKVLVELCGVLGLSSANYAA